MKNEDNSQLSTPKPQLIPPGYKQTEVGVIPEDWGIRALENVFKLKQGFAFSSEHFSRTGPVLLTPGNFRLDGGLYFEERNTKRYSGNYSPDMVFIQGDLLIVMTDLTPDCNLLGKPAFVNTNEIVLHNQRIGKVILKDKNTHLQFLYFALLSRLYLCHIKEQAFGSTVRHTSNKSIYCAELPWPPPLEQRAIATALSDVDALLDGLDRLIAKKRDLKQAAMQQLLTGKTRLPGFEGEWEKADLKQLVETPITDGPHMTPRFLEIGVPFLSVNNLVDNRINLSDLRYISKADDKVFARKCKPRRGDVLLGKAASVGKVAIVEDDFDFNIWSPIALVRVNDRINAKFLYYQLQGAACVRQIVLLTNSSSQGNIGMGDIEKLQITYPSTDEQIAIATVLSDMDAEIAALEQRRAKTKDIKQAMMQELLTGKTRLI